MLETGGLDTVGLFQTRRFICIGLGTLSHRVGRNKMGLK